jgi:putative two-component system response regulator
MHAESEERKARVLVVDDEVVNRRLIEGMLTALGYAVTTACDGRDALEKARLAGPDVILLDILMPEVGGYEAARRLKADVATALIPIVMVTALNGLKDRVAALEAGADDFLSKPVDPGELGARVKSLVTVKRYHDQQRHYREELEAEVARRTGELSRALKTVKEASLDTIYRLARAAEYRDDCTGSHLARVSRVAAAIARRMGLPPDQVETLLYAAPMHDVGKIAIPDSILLKPGKLTAEEWNTMKQHTTKGAAILSGSDSALLKMAERVAISHHEKWDGSGYPAGLKGEAIPLAGRITAIADVFDALTSRRPYKEPFAVDTALTILRENRSVHFDPAVVDAFFAIEDEILDIRKTYADMA